MNTLKTALLLIGMTALFMLIGEWIAGLHGMLIAFVLAMAMNVISYWYSDKIVLRMYNAIPISENEAPELYSIIRRLSQNAGLPMPKVYIVPGNVANAFATGRNPENAAIAVTEGLMKVLDRDEVEGVLSHELAHIKNRDILIGTVAATIAGAIMMLIDIARWGMILGGGSRSDDDNGGALALLLAMILAPIAAMLIQMAISRSREYQADATGAQISGNPLGLANALEKLEEAAQVTKSYGNMQTAHMFIVNPLKGGFARLFSTHPPTSERIARLRKMAQSIG